MTPSQKIFDSAGSFRHSLEMRLNDEARITGRSPDRLRKQVAFERLLARLFHSDSPIWFLKGGYAIELWLKGLARATRDIDLSIPYETLAVLGYDYGIDEVYEALLDAAETDMADWFEFRISEPSFELESPPYGGARFRVEALINGRIFAVFKLDIGIGDAVIGNPEWITGNEHLSFASIPPARIALLPKAQQFAEKLHAYTHPRDGRLSSRPKDLLDMYLLIEDGLPVGSTLNASVDACFTSRYSKRCETLPVIPESSTRPVR